MDLKLKNKYVREDESLSDSNSDAITVVETGIDVESLTDCDCESPIEDESDSIRFEGLVEAHTGARSKETKITYKKERNTDKYDDKDDKNNDDYDGDNNDDGNFNYYNEDWTPENPFQTGTLKLHPDDPFYKRDLMENIELYEDFQPEDILQRRKRKQYESFINFHMDACAEVEEMDTWIKDYFVKENNFERARFVLKLSTSKILTLSSKRIKKSERKAQELESYFEEIQDSDAKNALKIISSSIRSTMENSYKDKARRYRMRAHLLYHAFKSEAAFRDARRSLVYNANSEVAFPSFDILAMCYWRKCLWNKSKYCFRKALLLLQEWNIDEANKTYLYKRYNYYLNQAEIYIEQEKPMCKKCSKRKGLQKEAKQEEKDKEKTSDFKNYGIDNKVELPELAKGPHIDRKNLSSLVYCKFEPEIGRGLYALEDIIPGDVLIVEKPHAFALFVSKFDSKCCICFQKVLNPIPCSLCENVWYCGEKCMSISIVRHIHEHECEVMPYLLDPAIENMTLLTYRIITRFPWQKLKQYLPAINTSRGDIAEIFEQFNHIDDEHKEVAQKINTDIFFLKTNGRYRKFDDLFKKSMASVYILECLRVGGYFKDDPPTKEERVKIVSIALKHLQAAECNADTVFEYHKQKNHSIDIGSAIHPTVSLVNHSCFPNAFCYYINNVCILRATRYIEKEQQIYNSYNISYDAIPREERKSILAKLYKFVCKCEACVGNWPLFANNSKPLIYYCPEDDCTEIKFNQNQEFGCPRLGRMTKKTTFMFNYLRLRVLILNSIFNNKSYRKQGDVKAIKELQNTIDKISRPPFEILSLCQEVLKIGFMLEGNVHQTYEEL